MRRRVDSWPVGRHKKKTPRVPTGTRIYAVGDIHGCVGLLDPLLARIDADLAANPIEHPIQVFLGDYLDRGPASREVLDRLIELVETDDAVCLKGNHEAFVLEFLENPENFDDWRRWGGLETLISYGLVPSGIIGQEKRAELANALKQAMPRSHQEFLAGLPLTYSCGDFFFVHAGVRPGVKLAAQEEHDLIWIRDEFLSSEADFGKMIIHGHTPVEAPEFRRNRINIDTGAFVTGRLTCLVIEDESLFLI